MFHRGKSHNQAVIIDCKNMEPRKPWRDNNYYPGINRVCRVWQLCVPIPGTTVFEKKFKNRVLAFIGGDSQVSSNFPRIEIRFLKGGWNINPFLSNVSLNVLTSFLIFEISSIEWSKLINGRIGEKDLRTWRFCNSSLLTIFFSNDSFFGNGCQ